MTSTDPYPPYVSFRDGARLLVREGLAASMTHQGLRYIARRKDWPFGEGPGKSPYLIAGRTRLMQTETFLAFFREVYTPKGRGPARENGDSQ